MEQSPSNPSANSGGTEVLMKAPSGRKGLRLSAPANTRWPCTLSCTSTPGCDASAGHSGSTAALARSMRAMVGMRWLGKVGSGRLAAR